MKHYVYNTQCFSICKYSWLSNYRAYDRDVCAFSGIQKCFYILNLYAYLRINTAPYTSESLVVFILEWPNHSCASTISASCSSALVAAVVCNVLGCQPARVGFRTEKSRLQRSLTHLCDLMRRMRHLAVRDKSSILTITGVNN